MKICEVLKKEEVDGIVNSMFRMLCLGIINHDKFMGGVIFAKSCGLLTDAELIFLSNASWNV